MVHFSQVRVAQPLHPERRRYLRGIADIPETARLAQRGSELHGCWLAEQSLLEEARLLQGQVESWSRLLADAEAVIARATPGCDWQEVSVAFAQQKVARERLTDLDARAAGVQQRHSDAVSASVILRGEARILRRAILDGYDDEGPLSEDRLMIARSRLIDICGAHDGR